MIISHVTVTIKPPKVELLSVYMPRIPSNDDDDDDADKELPNMTG